MLSFSPELWRLESRVRGEVFPSGGTAWGDDITLPRMHRLGIVWERLATSEANLLIVR